MQGEFDENLEKLRDGFSGSRDSPNDLHSEYNNSDFHNTLFDDDFNSSPEDFKFKFPAMPDDYEGDVDSEVDFQNPRKSMSHGGGISSTPYDEEEELKMKLACYDLIMEYIGFTASASPYSASVSSKTSANSLVGKLEAKEISDMMSSPRRGSTNVYSSHSRRFSVDSTTEEDGISMTGSISQSACLDPFMELEIRRVAAGEILIEEGICVNS
jgi:hypothetical protein